MTSDPILLETDGATATLTINRPETLNALDTATISAMNTALDRVEADPEIRVLIFTGAGRAFIAGGDIADLNSRRGLPHYEQFAEDIHKLFRRIETFDKPTIGAVNGFALGGGTELLLALDIRILSDKARLGLPEITLGLFPGAGGTQRIIRQLPLCRAKEIMYTGDMLTPDEAVSVGLANRVVPHDDLMQSTRETAAKIAHKSPLVLKLLKRTLVDGGDMPLSAALRHEQAMIGLVLDSADAHEGCTAFLEKRDANFTGR
ncbi:enoyl-CoA hydratase/isomerase family protein [Antarcticimicrobium luteum]|uniref:Enoyl-CoA hydratase/isomerase family protein n=1 Tax=Antarcticimicrobium luteum TaxID=2547397 RepID=A0A4V3AQ35_9RHOB|nr:enoyl-CoA hydratase/isomerase family protein [Antarcticimicrobium luteum]TDK41187.1 enoyl-CoA hydratase/isomerase family protein [Antarcticimicrobium luteum]